MKKPINIILGCALAMCALLGAAAAQGASASPDPRPASQLVAPAIQANGSSFYTEDQIDDAWKAVLERFPYALPEGYSFPTTFPRDIPVGTKAYFEAALPDMAIAQQWRCAWLDSRVNRLGASRASAAEITKVLSAYWELPSVASHDLTGYNAEMLAAFARSNGLRDADDALYQLDCQGVSPLHS